MDLRGAALLPSFIAEDLKFGQALADSLRAPRNAGIRSDMQTSPAGMVNMPVRMLAVCPEMNPAIHGRTEPPNPAVNNIHRESAVLRVRAKKPESTRG